MQRGSKVRLGLSMAATGLLLMACGAQPTVLPAVSAGSTTASAKAKATPRSSSDAANAQQSLERLMAKDGWSKLKDMNVDMTPRYITHFGFEPTLCHRFTMTANKSTWNRWFLTRTRTWKVEGQYYPRSPRSEVNQPVYHIVDSELVDR